MFFVRIFSYFWLSVFLGIAFPFVSRANEIVSFIIHSIWLLLHRKTIDFSKLFVLNHQTEYVISSGCSLDNSLIHICIVYSYICYILISS